MNKKDIEKIITKIQSILEEKLYVRLTAYIDAQRSGWIKQGKWCCEDMQKIALEVVAHQHTERG